MSSRPPEDQDQANFENGVLEQLTCAEGSDIAIESSGGGGGGTVVTPGGGGRVGGGGGTVTASCSSN